MPSTTRNRQKEAALDLEFARGLIAYDPETGKLTWKRPPRRGVGLKSVVGGMHLKGYRTITINGEAFLAANLIWFLVHGEWPEESIDHINKDRADDRLCNLRQADQTHNNFNTKIRSNNTTGVTGVSFSKSKKKYVVGLKKHGKYVCHEYFSTLNEAVAARQMAEQIHCGEFVPQQGVI